MDKVSIRNKEPWSAAARGFDLMRGLDLGGDTRAVDVGQVQHRRGSETDLELALRGDVRRRGRSLEEAQKTEAQRRESQSMRGEA